MAMSKYEAIMWEEKMKDEIKSLGRAVHGQSLSRDCVFDAISYKDETSVSTRPTYTSVLILYTSWGSKFWRVLTTAEPFKFSSVDKSLEALLDELREQLGKEMTGRGIY